MEQSLEIESAVELDGELPFLIAISRDAFDFDARSRYADWLTENGDEARGSFMRDLSIAIKNLCPETKIPRLYSYDTSWTNMVGLPLVNAIVEHDLYEHSKFLFNSAKPALKIELENVIKRAMLTGVDTPQEDELFAIGQTKFEGLPDLPANVDWPQNEHGLLRFLAQINLAEISGTVASQSLPIHEGMLSFFAMPGENEPTGDANDGSCIVLYSAPNVELSRRPLPSGIAEECESGPAVKLRLTETWDLPGSSTLGTMEFQSEYGEILNDEIVDQLHEIRRELHQFTNLLFGYPVDFQSFVDPTPDEYSNILTLTDSSATRWFWGDGDRLNISVLLGSIVDLGETQPACGVVG